MFEIVILGEVPSHKLISDTANDKSASWVTVTVTLDVYSGLFEQP